MILIDTIGANSEHYKCSETLELNRERLKKVTEILNSDKLNTLLCEESNAHIERLFERGEFDKKLYSLHTNWKALSTRIAADVESWAAQRRGTLRLLESLIEKLESIRILSSVGRLCLSSADAVGTGIALCLQSMQNSWSRSLLHASGAVGLSGLAVAFLEDYLFKTSIANVIEELRKDQELFQKIHDDYKKLVELDRRVRMLFPHGIDVRLLEFVRSRFVEDSHEVKELFDVLKPIGKLEGNWMISLVVILSNAGNDISLLDDEHFIQSVKKFSTSSFVKDWWNRALNLDRFPSSTNPETLSKLQTLLKKDSAALHNIQVPLLRTSAMYYEGIPTLLSIFLNSIMAVDALLELNKKDSKTESVLSGIKQVLKKEYDEIIQFNEVLNPYYN